MKGTCHRICLVDILAVVHLIDDGRQPLFAEDGGGLGTFIVIGLFCSGLLLCLRKIYCIVIRLDGLSGNISYHKFAFIPDAYCCHCH
jgi:hypothetical protein